MKLILSLFLLCFVSVNCARWKTEPDTVIIQQPGTALPADPNARVFNVVCYCWSNGALKYGPVQAVRLNQNGYYGIITLYPSYTVIRVHGNCFIN